MTELMNVDVAVIGGGITGLSTAYNLAKKGKKVAVIEKYYVASQGSGRNAGGVRQQGRLPAEVPVVMECMKLWHSLDKELGVDTEFRVTGNVFLATTEKEFKLHEKMVERLNKQGLEVFLLDEKEMLKVVPALKKGACVGGSYCPSDGMANPLYTTLGYAGACQNKGVEILEYTEALDIKVKNKRVDYVITTKGNIKCDVVVIAAGSWSPLLGEKIGIDIPITPCRNQMVVTEPIPPLVKPFLLTNCVYCNQTANGNMIIGNVDPDDFCVSNNANVNENKLIARNILKFIPALAHVHIIRSWGGPLDLTPDDMAILGGVEGLEGVVLACGFSGHGFAVGPIIGKLLAQYILTGTTELPLEPFSLSRFKENKTQSGEVFAYGQAIGKIRHQGGN